MGWKRRSTDLQLGPELEAVDLTADQLLLHGALEALRSRFHERTWQAFLRTTMDGRPPRDVGDELEMSPGAVRVAKSRVLPLLRSELGD